MRTLVIRDLVENTSSNEQGLILYHELKRAFQKAEKIILKIDSTMSLSSSFLNSSLGSFMDEFGLQALKSNIKIQGPKSQFDRLADYVNRYSKIYHV